MVHDANHTNHALPRSIISPSSLATPHVDMHQGMGEKISNSPEEGRCGVGHCGLPSFAQVWEGHGVRTTLYETVQTRLERCLQSPGLVAPKSYVRNFPPFPRLVVRGPAKLSRGSRVDKPKLERRLGCSFSILLFLWTLVSIISTPPPI